MVTQEYDMKDDIRVQHFIITQMQKKTLFHNDELEILSDAIRYANAQVIIILKLERTILCFKNVCLKSIPIISYQC